MKAVAQLGVASCEKLELTSLCPAQSGAGKKLEYTSQTCFIQGRNFHKN